MQGKTKERWMELAEQAANEQDLNKLLKLVDEINQMLEAKENRLNTKADAKKSS
jgi:hypothetical protein